MKTLKVDVKVGDTLSFDDGRVSITLLEKSGQRARLSVRSEADVKIDLPSHNIAAQLAQRGITHVQ